MIDEEYYSPSSCHTCGSCTCSECIDDKNIGRCVKDGAKIAAAAHLMRSVLRPIHDYLVVEHVGPQRRAEIQAAMKAYDDAVRKE